MEQARDFLDESEALAAILSDLDDADFEQPTQFKGWTINDVLVHLHFWNRGADQALTDPPAFEAATGRLMEALAGASLRGFENAEISERGTDLLDAWRALYRDMGERWASLDPKQRVKWVGPDMSVRSSMTARQMETWAHGQEVFDVLGIERAEQDRIRNVVVLGVNTFGWSFKVHGKPVPETMPHLTLTLPSRAVVEHGEAGSGNAISGPAVAFAQVVTQTRNIADTDLVVEGPVAREWMENAQCWAGPPETPPAPGTRFRKQA